MNAAQVLTVIRDHTATRLSGTGRVCHCGQAFFSGPEHLQHLAEAIAAASTSGDQGGDRGGDASVIAGLPAGYVPAQRWAVEACR